MSDKANGPFIGAEHMTARSYQCLCDALSTRWDGSWDDTGIPVAVVAELDPKTLLKHANFGRKSLGEIRALLRERGGDFSR